MSEAEKEQRLNQEEGQDLTAEEQQFATLLEKFDYGFKRGDIIKGQTIRHEARGALVDIGAKTLAFIPNKEISTPYPEDMNEALPKGEELDFYILREDTDEEKFVLSRKRVYQAQTWGKLKEAFENDEVIDCSVSNVVKGGLLVDVRGLRGFVPSSHLRVRESFESLLGKELPLKILSLDQAQNNIILSHRKVVAEQLAEQRKDLFSNLEVGSLVEGEVVRLTEFGAFIDLGGVDGLLPLSQMSWRWVEHPSDILKVADKVKVEVIGIDLEKQRVSLSIKSQYEDPWTQVGKELALGDKVEGTITRLKHFGAFVEVFPGVEALLPSRDLAEHETELDKKLDTGETIAVYIVKFSPGERRISLSFRPPHFMQDHRPTESTNGIEDTEEPAELSSQAD